MTSNLLKKHWYDGWIYAKFIDRNNLPFRKKIFTFIDPDKTVLDVGCGTGGFTLELAKRCKRVTGIDVSKKQIDEANKRLRTTIVNNVEFIHVHGSHIREVLHDKFDYAVFSFMLHEIPQKERLEILKEISLLANTFIILEYYVPHPHNFWGLSTRLIEFIAGWHHFTNFMEYKKRGGITQILTPAGFKINQKIINRNRIFTIVIANKPI